MSYTTPGVYVNEAPLGSLVTNTVGVAAAVFFGEAERGPTVPTRVSDWSTYRSVYGDLSNAYDLGYAVYHFFANGGRSAYIRRVVDATATVASLVSVPFFPDGTSAASATLFDVAAVSAGTWGNGVSVGVIAGSSSPSSTSLGSFTLSVVLDGKEVERWPDLSIDEDANRFVGAVVNRLSKFIRVSNFATNVAPDVLIDYASGPTPLSGGTQGSVAGSDYVTALTDLDSIDGNLILNAVGQTSSPVVTAFVNKASERGDSFVIIDPNKDDTDVADIQATAANYSGLSFGGYAAVYAPTLEMVDPAKTGAGAVRTTYPGGALAGLYVRTETERTVAKTPAGFGAEVRGALGLSLPINDSDIGVLYNGNPQVNSFKAVPGAGVTVYGGRTLTKTTPDKFISVRRTLNYLKASLKEQTRFAVFEPNDERLWSRINLSVSGFLGEFWRSGGLKGNNASEAFYVLCNSTNNDQSAIDQGIVNIEVGVALQYPTEFVVINLSQWTGGSNAVES
jgi:hypothetical protein